MTAATLPERHHAPNDLIAALGEAFQIKPGEHFRLIHDTSEQSAQVLVSRLDQTYDAVARFLKSYELEFKPPSAPLVAVLFGHKEDYVRYVRQNELPLGASAGFFSPESNLAVFWDIRDHPAIRLITERIKQRRLGSARRNVIRSDDVGPSPTNPTQQGPRTAPSENERTPEIEALRAERDALVRRFNDLVVAHEATHQALYNLGFPVLGSDGPAWLVEGLACQFEVPQPHLADGHLAVNPMRRADLRTALGVGPGTRQLTAEQYRKALDSGHLVPLSELITSPNFTTNGGEPAFRYAQSWALIFYLHHQHRDGFAKLLKSPTSRQLTAAPDAIRRFEVALGPLDEHWELACVAFALSRPDSASGH